MRLPKFCSFVSAFCGENFFLSWLVLRLDTGFLDDVTIYIFRLTNFFLRGLPWDCKMLTSTPGLFLLDALSLTPPSPDCDNQKCLRHFCESQNDPWLNITDLMYSYNRFVILWGENCIKLELYFSCLVWLSSNTILRLKKFYTENVFL